MNRMSDRAMARRDMRDRARRDREMRDYARGGRGRDMARGRRDYEMDGRNPYGSRGGYVTSRRGRRDREMEDMARGRDRGMDYGSDYGYDSAEYDGRNDYGDYGQYDYEGNDMGYQRDRQSDRGKMPFEVYGSVDMQDFARRRNSRGQYMRDRAMDGHYPFYTMPYMDYGMDYGSGEKLDEEDLKEWYEELCEEVPEQYKHLYKKEHIEQVAKQMNVEFEKFKPMELVVATVMVATDYPKSVGFADINRNVAMAKEWLEDKDSNLKGGEKLSAYYDNVVKG